MKRTLFKKTIFSMTRIVALSILLLVSIASFAQSTLQKTFVQKMELPASPGYRYAGFEDLRIFPWDALCGGHSGRQPYRAPGLQIRRA